jgi:HAMP domain-containing protein/signal transduction histidine kinase/CheY-like chemotaxis protein
MPLEDSPVDASGPEGRELDSRELLKVLLQVRQGDFSARLPLDLVGVPGKIADTLNEVIFLNERLLSEVRRLRREVGREGRTHQRASRPGADGGWHECVSALNELLGDVTRPSTEMSRVVAAVAKGDLTETMALEVEGEPLRGDFLTSARALNAMVSQLAGFASEVTRVAREVGLEGKLGGQAEVVGVSGAWKELTDSVNSMALNLTAQVRNISEVTVAVANGDLSKKITVDVRGELLQLKDAINTMVDQLRVFAAEVTRVAREVGTEGRLGGQAVVLGGSGTWKDLTDSVNWMAANLTGQVRNIAEVSKAIANGDFTRKITVDVQGEMLELKNTINTMVDQLRAVSSEVTRVAREVGTDGKLGGQAEVPAVAGTWKDLTESVNAMASNLTAQVRNIADVTTAVAGGDLTRKITVDVKGELLELKNTINTMVDQLNAFASEVTRVAREVGTEGKLGGQAMVQGVGGTWKGLTDNVNFMASNLTGQVRNIAEVTTAVAAGDLTKKITVDAQGEIQELKRTINTMVDQLGSFASEVTRVAREVGTEGQLGGQAVVEGVAGTWKDLTVSVNQMASNLTGQVRNIADVATAIASGDLTKKVTVDVQGEILELKNTINTMVDQLRAFSSEVTRVAREVGTEGRLGGQAAVPDVAGTWKDLTDSVNQMASNLTAQMRNIAEVTTAVATGDLTKKISVDVRGEILELKNTINTMVDQLNGFASEVTRVAREVGTEGRLGGQAVVRGVGGTWKDLTDSVNQMAANLTGQVRNIAEVTTAVARGDLNRKVTADVRGEMLELKNTINIMVDQLNAFASEVTRVAREVGTEGKLGGQANVRGVGGTWKELTDNVNMMASNLTGQVRNIAEVTTAVATGDLSKKITADVRGEILELKNTINTMVDQLNGFASEVTRVAREVGIEGRLGGQANVKGVAGTWKELTDNVNMMAANLTGQVRNIAEVTTAVATGDLSKKITVPVKGEILQLKNTINTMVDQLNGFASEVTRVAREVGTEGKLGGQANVKGVAGTWKELTDNVNLMGNNLTLQVRNIADVTTAVATGDLSRKITVDARGEILELKDTINTMVDQLNGFASEVTRVAREVGTEGRLGGQARVRGVAGTWKDLTDNVNLMASNLTDQVRNIAEVTTAVANGDLSRKITVDVKGEILELKNTINRMVDQLNAFASEVTRVAREVGTEGILGGQAEVRGVGGTWKDLTDNVNRMAANLTTQVRSIAQVVTAVANGDLKRKLVLEARGEIAQLAETINGMVDTLALFADQVSTVAREVGIEGKLGGQSRVPGAAGTWRGLTDNVNQLAANLTTQVRAIARVATAVAQGDLSRTITVEAQGEVAELKDNVNQMISNLKDTTQRAVDQDWLKTNLARFVRMLQGQRDLLTVGNLILSELAPLVTAQQGMFYVAAQEGSETVLRLLATYAHRDRKHMSNVVHWGEGIVGQAAIEQKRILLTEVPPDYVSVRSGLGSSTPRTIIVLPVVFEGRIKAVVELASFSHFSEVNIAFLEQLTESIAIVLNSLEATMRTEELLRRSQALTNELQARQEQLTETNQRLEAQTAALRESEELLRGQQEELRNANDELGQRAGQLGAQNAEVERKNREVEQGRRLLEEKAEQLSLTSRYKSEFLANMSHELRTPLNSILILADVLAENREARLNERDIEAARNIAASGHDLLELINEILDLSKVESGTVAVDVVAVGLSDALRYVETTFRAVALAKGLSFVVEADHRAPATLYTDGRRLQQILKNLLSNAFKFTETGEVRVTAAPAACGWPAEHEVLDAAVEVVAFRVRDTGIGIPKDKQRVVFEAFQQVDSSIQRKYGGTGLGLAISRELTRLLGGALTVESELGRGSTFTLYLPVQYTTAAPSDVVDIIAVTADPEARGTPGDEPEAPPASVPAVREPSEPPELPAVERAQRFIETEVLDDRALLQPGEPVLAIVEDDVEFAGVIMAMARERGYRVLLAQTAAEAPDLVRRALPSAVLLDIRLPDRSGWTVLDAMKQDPRTRHIPVYVVSVVNDLPRGLRLGARAVLHKPAGKEAFERLLADVETFRMKPRRLLLVAPELDERTRLLELLGGDDVEIVAVGSGADALAQSKEGRLTAAVLDIRMDDMTPQQLIARLRTEPALANLPVVVWAPSGTSHRLLADLRMAAEVVHAEHADAEVQLLDRIGLYLHRDEGALEHGRRDRLARWRARDPALAGQRVLVVDDDVRNIFALTTVLEQHGMTVFHAENGKEALELLEKEHVDIVLMDVMMPVMDGYQATRAIRQIGRFAHLPVICLTAKAMRGDRESCLAAGASDYVAKPVEIPHLLSLLRVWLVT